MKISCIIQLLMLLCSAYLCSQYATTKVAQQTSEHSPAVLAWIGLLQQTIEGCHVLLGGWWAAGTGMASTMQQEKSHHTAAHAQYSNRLQFNVGRAIEAIQHRYIQGACRTQHMSCGTFQVHKVRCNSVPAAIRHADVCTTFVTEPSTFYSTA